MGRVGNVGERRGVAAGRPREAASVKRDAMVSQAASEPCCIRTPAAEWLTASRQGGRAGEAVVGAGGPSPTRASCLPSSLACSFDAASGWGISRQPRPAERLRRTHGQVEHRPGRARHHAGLQHACRCPPGQVAHRCQARRGGDTSAPSAAEHPPQAPPARGRAETPTAGRRDLHGSKIALASGVGSRVLPCSRLRYSCPQTAARSQTGRQGVEWGSRDVDDLAYSGRPQGAKLRCA